MFQHTTRIKNDKAPNSLVAGCLLLISAGMNMAQGLGFNHNGGFLLVSTNHFRMSWFIGGIIGVMLAPLLLAYIQKRIILGFSSVLALISGIIFAASPLNYDGLLAARYLNGIMAGITTITFLTHAGEIAFRASRGTLLALEQFSVAVGIFVQIAYSTYWDGDFPANRLHGILDICLAIFAVVSILLVTESPIFYIRRGDDAAALYALNRLQKNQGTMDETQQALEEYKQYVRDSDSYSEGAALAQSIGPLLKMIIYRGMVFAFTISLPLNTALIVAELINAATWTPILAFGLRILGGIVALFFVDRIGRKAPAVISLAFIGICMIVVASEFFNLLNIANSTRMWITTYLCVVIQFFAGLYNPLVSAYSGEAFPLKTKPVCIELCVLIELLIHIIIIAVEVTNLYACLLAHGILICLAFLAMCCTVPDTNNTTLAEAQSRFRNLINLKFF